MPGALRSSTMADASCTAHPASESAYPDQRYDHTIDDVVRRPVGEPSKIWSSTRSAKVPARRRSRRRRKSLPVGDLLACGPCPFGQRLPSPSVVTEPIPSTASQPGGRSPTSGSRARFDLRTSSTCSPSASSQEGPLIRSIGSSRARPDVIRDPQSVEVDTTAAAYRPTHGVRAAIQAADPTINHRSSFNGRSPSTRATRPPSGQQHPGSVNPLHGAAVRPPTM